MVEFELSDEQRALRAVAREFCAERFPETEVRRLMETAEGFDREVWRRLGRDVGLLGLSVPEEHGGAGAGLVDLAVVAEEFGRAVAPAPLLGTVALAVTALRAGADDAARAELLPAIAEGATVLALAATDARGGWSPAEPTVTATPADGGWRLSGEQAHVLDGAVADAVLVLAGTVAGPALFLVDGAAAGLTREPQSPLDQTRRQARLRYDGVPARAVGEPGTATAAVAAAREAAAASWPPRRSAARSGCSTSPSSTPAPGCSSAGRSVRSRRSSTAARTCWWRPSTPARPPTTRPGRTTPASTTRRWPPTWPRSCAPRPTWRWPRARCRCTAGGIGFTWEHPAHLYYKRAVSDAALLGGRAAAADRLAAAVLDRPLDQPLGQA